METAIKNSEHESKAKFFLPQRVGFSRDELSYDYMGSAEYEFGAGFVTHVALGQMIRDEYVEATAGIKIDFAASYGAGDPKNEPKYWTCFHSLGFAVPNPLLFGRTKENPFRPDTKLIVCYADHTGKATQTAIDGAPKIFFVRGDLHSKETHALLAEFQAKCLRAAANFDSKSGK